MWQQLRQSLAMTGIKQITVSARRRAAVLVPVYCRDGQYYLVLTKRTEAVKSHKGQISFPGGAVEEVDNTLVQTAVREACEEIGLLPAEVDILGGLDEVTTRSSDFIISPFVGRIKWPSKLQPSAGEVAAVLTVPVSALLDEGNLRQEVELRDGQPVVQYFYQYQGEVIWGATARILHQFLDIWRVLNKRCRTLSAEGLGVFPRA
jgi:8-oxo-dGTP pyrophosphatase MutT (NUDIX family)